MYPTEMYPTDMSDVGVSMREARMARSMSQAAVAESMSVSDQAVQHWERGRARPTPASMARWLSAVGIDDLEVRSAWWELLGVGQ